MNDLHIAILAGLGGMLGWGFSEFATKKSVDKVGAIFSLVWAHIFGTVLLLLFIFFRVHTSQSTLDLPTDPNEWVGVVFFGTLQTVVYFFSYKAFEKGEVSILSPIFASFAGLVALVSVLIFGEVLNLSLISALILIFGGVILINLDLESLKEKRLRLKSVAGLKEIIAATALAAIWTLGWDKFTTNKDWVVYTTLMFMFMTLSAFLIAKANKVKLLNAESGTWKFLWLIAIGEVVAYLAITLGYSSTNHVSVIAILSGASSLPTILLARIFLKEKMVLIQMVASLIIIVGIILLSIG